MIKFPQITRRETLALGTVAFALPTAPRLASAEASERHGISAFGDLKYPADFKYFDYVNPDAPKGQGNRVKKFVIKG